MNKIKYNTCLLPRSAPLRKIVFEEDLMLLIVYQLQVRDKDGSAISCNMPQLQLQVVATLFLYNAIATAIQFSYAAAIAEPSLVCANFNFHSKNISFFSHDFID